MSSLDRDPGVAGPAVQGFVGGGYSVGGQVYRGLLLTPQSAREWAAPPLASLGIGHLEPLFDLQPVPEFLLLGTGPALAFPPRTLTAALEERGIGIEVMGSRAAARIWGLLRGEERWIVGALMPLD